MKHSITRIQLLLISAFGLGTLVGVSAYAYWMQSAPVAHSHSEHAQLAHSDSHSCNSPFEGGYQSALETDSEGEAYVVGCGGLF